MYWPRAIFDAFVWGVGIFMLRQLRGFSNHKIDPKNWQSRVGNRITEELWWEINEWGFRAQFGVFLRPERTPFQIIVFARDPLAGLICGTDQRGTEIFRVEIQYPNLLAMTVFGSDDGVNKRSCYRRSEEQMLVDAKEILFYVVSKFMVEKVTG